jgi:hypothetical protein
VVGAIESTVTGSHFNNTVDQLLGDEEVVKGGSGAMSRAFVRIIYIVTCQIVEHSEIFINNKAIQGYSMKG